MTDNPIDDPRRQDFLEGLGPSERSEVTTAFFDAVRPGLGPVEVACEVRLFALSKAARDDSPTLSQWLVHRTTVIAAGENRIDPRASDFAAWCIEWRGIGDRDKVRHLVDVAMTRGALA